MDAITAGRRSKSWPWRILQGGRDRIRSIRKKSFLREKKWLLADVVGTLLLTKNLPLQALIKLSEVKRQGKNSHTANRRKPKGLNSDWEKGLSTNRGGFFLGWGLDPLEEGKLARNNFNLNHR